MTDDRRERRREGADDPRGVLVAEDREAGDHGLSPDLARQRLGERPGAVGVVRGVEDHRRVAVDELEAARQLEARRARARTRSGLDPTRDDLRRRERDRQIAPR